MYLKSFVYGGIDGIITLFNVISSVEGAKLDHKYIIIIAFSVLIADALSMGIADYLSTNAENKYKNTNINPIKSGLVTLGSFILFGLIPLIIFFLMNKINKKNRYQNTLFSMMIAFFIMGTIQSKYTKETWYIEGGKTVFYGTGTSLIAYKISQTIEKLIK